MTHFISGFDPGKQTDPAALAVCQQFQVPDPIQPTRLCWAYHVRHLAQWPLGTPYTTVGQEVGVGEQVRDLFARPPLNGSLIAFGQTGVGEAVIDIFRGLKIPAVIIGLVETGGMAWRQTSGLTYHVSKYELASLLVALFASGRILIAREEDGLPLARVLAKQLARFSEKQSPAGSLTWEAERAQDKDDLVMALAMCCWLGERAPPYTGSMIGRGRPSAAHAAPPGTFLPAGPGLGRAGKVPERW